MQDKELGGPVLFDHTHQKDKGKGPYPDKMSEVVVVSIKLYLH